MIRFLTCSIALGLASTASIAEDKPQKTENFYKRAKVGDWISHKTTIKGQPFETVAKQTVTAKDDKTITIKTDMKASGMDFSNEAKLPLEPAIDPDTPNPAVKTETLGKGKETIKVGGKSYACEWTKTKTTTKIENMETVSSPPCGSARTRQWAASSNWNRNRRCRNHDEITGSGKAKE